MKKILSIAAKSFILTALSVSAAGCKSTSTNSSKIDYANPANWCCFNTDPAKAADVFLLAPTSINGPTEKEFAELSDEDFRASYTSAIEFYKSVYDDECSVFSPFYRQITFPVYSKPLEEQEKYLSKTYEDVRDAFRYYLSKCDSSRPLILAGMSQGADMTIRLAKEFLRDKNLAKRVVAIYAIGWRFTANDEKEAPFIKLAQSETDINVFITFNTEDKNIKSSLIIPAGEKSYCINPLNWKTDATIAPKELNLGAYLGNESEKLVKNFTGCYINEERGTLVPTDVSPYEFPGMLFENGVYHIYEYAFYYENLRENVKTRIDEWKSAQTK